MECSNISRERSNVTFKYIHSGNVNTHLLFVSLNLAVPISLIMLLTTDLLCLLSILEKVFIHVHVYQFLRDTTDKDNVTCSTLGENDSVAFPQKVTGCRH